MYVYDREEYGMDNNLAFMDFVECIAVELASGRLFSKKRRSGEFSADNDDPLLVGECTMVRIDDIPGASGKRAKGTHQRCSVCKNFTHWCCKSCSTAEKVVALCNFGAAHIVPCFSVHQRKPTEQ